MSTDNWCTPPVIADGLEEYAEGPVGLDPCSNDRSIIRAKRRYTCAGTKLPWDADLIYENPPYSQMLRWTVKGLAELAARHRGRYKQLIRLVPATAATEWWPTMLTQRPAIMVTRRLPFIDEEGKVTDVARFDSALVLLHGDGATDRDRRRDQERFRAIFRHLERWWVEVDEKMAVDAHSTLGRIEDEKAERRAARARKKAA